MSKRGNNEGSIYQRKDGRWVGVLDRGHCEGRRVRKSVYGATRKEVQTELLRLLQAQAKGLPIESDRLMVGAWLKRWLENQEPPVTKPKTYQSYSDQVRLHLIPALGDRPLVKLQPQDVREFMKSKSDAGFSARSVRHFRATLRAALNVAMHDGLIARNVAALTKPPRLEKSQPHVFDQTEARRFLELVKGHRLEAVFTVALALGLREGEILGLRWVDVNLEAGTLSVAYALQRVKRIGQEKSKLELLSPKNDGSYRTLILPQVATKALAAHRMRQEEERLAAGGRWKESGMVFTTSIGTMLDQRNMLRDFYPIINTPDPDDPEPDPIKKRRLLPRLRFHDLRHSAATLLLVQGVHPRAIMELLGHSSISLTMNTYGHVLESMKRETAQKTDAILNPVAVTVAVKPAAGKPH